MFLDNPILNFLETEGTIQKAYVKSRRTQADLLLVNYNYQVAGAHYVGQTVVSVPPKRDKMNELKRQFNDLKPGKRITIWYLQCDPEKSYLHIGKIE